VYFDVERKNNLRRRKEKGGKKEMEHIFHSSLSSCRKEGKGEEGGKGGIMKSSLLTPYGSGKKKNQKGREEVGRN